MKTYTKNTTTTEPLLKIWWDDNCNPRDWDNLGYFITKSRRYYSPDRNELLLQILDETELESVSQEDHIKRLKEEIKKQYGETVEYIVPVTMYEHSGVSYSLGDREGFDFSKCGFYIVTKESRKKLGTPKKSFEKVIEQEIKDYNKYIQGEVYGFTLYDSEGSEIDSCGGFFEVEDIKEHLPKEWAKEDLTEYIIH